MGPSANRRSSTTDEVGDLRVFFSVSVVHGTHSLDPRCNVVVVHFLYQSKRWAMFLRSHFFWRHSNNLLPPAFTVYSWVLAVDIRRVCNSSLVVPFMPSLQIPGDRHTSLPFSWPASQGPHGQDATGVSPPPCRLTGFITLLGVLPVHALHNGPGGVCGEHQRLYCVWYDTLLSTPRDTLRQLF